MRPDEIAVARYNADEWSDWVILFMPGPVSMQLRYFRICEP